MRKIVAYHGTYPDRAQIICEKNFISSQTQKDWLGDGAYFFIDGCSDPKENAIEWAKNQAWDKNKGTFTQSNYSILKVEIELSPNIILDLCTIDGLNTFNQIRTMILEKHASHFKKEKNMDKNDCYLCNYIAEKVQIEAFISNLYIKDKIQRQLHVASRIPNVTVLVVKNPVDLIKIESINIVAEGAIK